MPFGIELLFDPPTEKAIRNIWRKLEKNKVSTPLGRDNPHVTLAAFNDADMGTIGARCRKISGEFSAIPASFESIGSFTHERVLFLAPVVTLELLRIHQKVHQSIRLLAEGQSPYYLPGDGWAPHCTLAMSKSDKSYLKSLKVMRAVPIGWKGRFTRLEAHEYELLAGGCSRRLRTVFSATLHKNKS